MTEGIDKKKMAVVVLNWNGLALLEQFLGNWEALTPDYAELIIVDNGSTDGSLEYVVLRLQRIMVLQRAIIEQ